jgi:hypothetical protein
MAVDPSKFDAAVASAASLLDTPDDTPYDDDIYLAYTRHIIEQMGGAVVCPVRGRDRGQVPGPGRGGVGHGDRRKPGGQACAQEPPAGSTGHVKPPGYAPG